MVNTSQLTRSARLGLAHQRYAEELGGPTLHEQAFAVGWWFALEFQLRRGQEA